MKVSRNVGFERARTRLAGVLWMSGALLCLASGRSAAGSIGLSRTTAAGVPVIVLTVDMNDDDVKVAGMVSRQGSGSSERFDSMVRRTHPTAAFTGTYFSTRDLVPIGDLVVDGIVQHRGRIGTALAITGTNGVSFVRRDPHDGDQNWNGFDFVCDAGPALVRHGKVSVSPAEEGFHDRHLLGYATRLAVGRTARNKLKFVATRRRISLSMMAKAMRKLGCVDAINLDAGSSLGFYDGGRVLIRPDRKLTNLILVYDDRRRYQRFLARLAPSVARQARRAPRPQAVASTAYPLVRRGSGRWSVR